MTTEEKKLVLKDLCARVLYSPRIYVEGDWMEDDRDSYDSTLTFGRLVDYQSHDYVLKPYLRPLSSMTENEVEELIGFLNKQCSGRVITKDNFELTGFGVLWFTNMKEYECVSTKLMTVVIDYLNAHHLDYLGLIEMGLALKAPDDMYQIK